MSAFLVAVLLFPLVQGQSAASTTGVAQSGKTFWEEPTDWRNCHGIEGEGGFGLVNVGLQAAAPTQSVAFDHVHIGVPDPAKAIEWYQKLFGGQMMPRPRRLVFGPTRFDVSRTDTAKPSAGSLLDHLGFSVADLDASMQIFQAEGVNVVQPVREVPELYKRALIEDPWGTRIAVVQDPQKVGFHHVHLLVPNPEASLQWYAKQFGGTVGKLKGKIDGIEYAGFWLLAERGDGMKPSRGHAIDHLGFRPTDMDSLVAGLRAQNVKVTSEPRAINNPGRPTIHIAFIEDPDGIGIELIQR